MNTFDYCQSMFFVRLKKPENCSVLFPVIIIVSENFLLPSFLLSLIIIVSENFLLPSFLLLLIIFVSEVFYLFPSKVFYLFFLSLSGFCFFLQLLCP